MGRSSETFGKKDVRNNQLKKRKDKEAKRLAKKEQKGESKSLDDMIAYVDEYGVITSTPPEEREKAKPREENFENKPNPSRRRTGIIKKIFQSGGYGFILDLESNKSIYMRLSDCEHQVEIGNTVEFTSERGDRGFVAKEIRRVKEQ